MLRTVVTEREGRASGTAEEILARVAVAMPRASSLASEGPARLAVPLGRTGIQQVVVDLAFGPE